MSIDLERVRFMTTEEEDDFIVSFYVARPQDPLAGRSITLMRDKKWEHLVADADKGVTLSDEDVPEHDHAEENHVEAISIDHEVARIETKHRSYSLDLRNVDRTEIESAEEIFKKMNHDGRIKLTIG